MDAPYQKSFFRELFYAEISYYRSLLQLSFVLMNETTDASKVRISFAI